MDLKFPVQDHLTEDQYRLLLVVARKHIQSKYTEARDELKQVISTIDQDSQEDIYKRSIFRYWLTKVDYASGQYLEAYKGTQEIAKDVKKVIDQGEDTPETNLIYWLLKAQTASAKCLNKIKDTDKAENVCQDVINFVDEYRTKEPEEVHSFFYFAIKAHYMMAKNMQKVMEFRTALKILDEKAKPLLKLLLEKFHVRKEDEVQDMTKELVDDPYSFIHRRKFCLYLKKFAFYERSSELLQIILAEMIEYYKLAVVQAVEGDSTKAFKRINLEGISEAINDEKYLLNPSLLPLNQIRKVYFQLAKVNVFRLKVKEAVEGFEAASEIAVAAAFDEQQILYVAHCKGMIKEAHIKNFTQRNKQALVDAEKAAYQQLDITEKILGDGANYHIAKSLLQVGDILIQKKENDESEKVILRAQIMIGECYSDNHPCILEFNNNLIEVYSNMDESKKAKTVNIAEKNLEIAKEFYGDDSIFALKYLLSYSSNSIGALKLQEAQTSIANMRKIVQRFHDDNPHDLMNQYLFLGQVLISITLMSTQNAQSAGNILNYVLQKQLEYVGMAKYHPFLEQTLTNLAILRRSSQQYLESLQMWEWLKNIQENVYGQESEVLIYTYKNIGICYLALGIPEKAEDYYLKAITLMELMQQVEGSAPELQDQELLKEDREQLGTLYHNLFISAISNNEREKAREYNLKTMQYYSLIYGENSLQVSNCKQIQSTLALRLGQLDDSVRWMEEALRYFDKDQVENDEELQNSQDEIQLIKVRYFSHFASVYYIKGDYKSAKEYIDRAMQICESGLHQTFDTVESYKKQYSELQTMNVKCEAKLLGISAIELKKRKVSKAETVAIAAPQQSNLVPLMSVFGIFSGAGFLLSYALMKMKE